MSIINAVRKTIAYAKRNGPRAAFFAALERVRDTRNNDYRYVPPSEEALKEQRQEYRYLAGNGDVLKFSIVVPLYNTPDNYLREMIESVISQTYEDWELILADASEKSLETAIKYAGEDPRIIYNKLEENRGISENTNAGIEIAGGDYTGLLDHDDILAPDALYEMARTIRERMHQDKLVKFSECPLRLIYSDEDKFDDERGAYYEQHIKPAFNMDYLLSNNYICHFTMLRTDIIKRLKLRSEYDGAQDYDLFLRACAEAALSDAAASDTIAHVGKVVYHWRCHKGSTAANPASKTYAYEAGLRALQSIADDYGINAKASQLKHLGFYRLEYSPDVFLARSDVGCVGGKILSRRGRISGGMYRKNRSLCYENLPEGFSGGFQHRAVLQQDAPAVDIRCLAVRNELIPLYEEITGLKYRDTLGEGTLYKNEDDPFCGMTKERIADLSFLLGSEIRKRGYRIMWDPQIVRREQ